MKKFKKANVVATAVRRSAVKRNLARCEMCGKLEKPSKTEGWSQFGASRYGVKHQAEGLAWYCPHCA